MKIQGIINKPTNLTLVPGMVGPKRWSNSSCKTFLGTEGKGAWRKDGFIRAKSCLNSPGTGYGKKTRLEEHWMSFALILAMFLT